MRGFIAVLLAWLCCAGSALAENRLALVIGNDDYQHIAKLRKAVADATAYENVLREKGFSIQVGYDLSMERMKLAVADFVEKIQPGDTVVFIYSGYGWSDGSQNYLVGVDAPGRVSRERLTALSMPLRNGVDGVLDGLQRKSPGLVAAIIDASRDDPFQTPPGEKGYALARGLKPQSVDGSFVIYSASEGQTAMDALSEADADPNSVFTRTFLPELRADRPLQDAIKLSQQKTHALAASANHDQTPAYYDNVLGEACLSAACKTSGAASTETGTGTKVALVIGNSKYASVDELPNPANDADSIADALSKIGFKVTVKKDVTRQEFGTALKEFSHESSKADTVLFYFSGHGVQVNGKNYLMPTDSKDVEYDSIPIDLVVGAANKAHKTKILVLDASRDDGASNKYATASETPSRSLTPMWTGFAPFETIDNADGLIIFYSAQPGKEAINDAGSKNSPFAVSLAKRLVEPNAKMADTFKLVISDVLARTSNRQKPVYSAAPPDIVLYIVLYPAEPAEEAWRRIKNSNDPEKFREFIRQYPDSPLADVSQLKLDNLDKDRRANEAEQHANQSVAPPTPAPTKSPAARSYKLPVGAQLVPQLSNSSAVNFVRFSPDGVLIASGSDDHTIKLWDAASGRLLRTFEGHSRSVWSVTFSPDGARIASGGADKSVKLWDAASGRLLRSFEGHSESVTSVVFSPDGARIASGSNDHTIRLWDAASDRLLRTFEDSNGVQSVAFSPDGARIASGSADPTIKLWDAASGRLLRTFEGAVFSVAFSPDGARIASGSDDHTIRLWDAASGHLLRTFEGHSNGVLSIAFSPDGARIASGSDDQTIKLWDAASGRLLRTLEGHSANVTSVALSPDGAHIASGSGDNTIRLWDAASGALLATLFTYDGKGLGFTPDGLFFGDADPRAAFAIVRGSTKLPMDDFIALDRRESLAEALAPKAAAAK